MFDRTRDWADVAAMLAAGSLDLAAVSLELADGPARMRHSTLLGTEELR